MTTRRCGYCRSSMHNFSKCEAVAKTIDAARRHVGYQRYWTLRKLIESGVGTGAIISVPDMYGENPVPHMVHDINEAFADTYYNFAEFYNVRRSKAVATYLQSAFDGDSFANTDLRIHARPFGSMLRLYVRSLDGTGNKNIAYFNMADLSAFKKNIAPNYYGFNQPAKILSPSGGDEIDRQLLLKPFHISERLTRGETQVAPILPDES